MPCLKGSPKFNSFNEFLDKNNELTSIEMKKYLGKNNF